MKKEIWKNYFDVVILPPEKISDYSIELSKGLKKYGTKWTLGKNSFIPHISLYHIAVKPKDFPVFVSELEKIAKNFSPGYLETTIIDSNSLILNKPDWIKNLHLKIINKTVKFFDWNWGTEKTWFRPLPKTNSVKKFGTPIVGNIFQPHISLTSFKDRKTKISRKKSKKFSFKPGHIYICELGPTHSCQRIVEKIPFGGKKK